MYNRQLDAFIKTADLGSFSKAAEAMYISTPAVIQQINLMENRCGFRLFIRSTHGVKLTSAGKSFYEDAKTLIRLSEDALDRARLLAQSSEYTVRVATSLLYKCRLLPEIWARASRQLPELKIEILPMAEYQTRGTSFSMLGVRYDMWEGIYGTISWKGMCQFLELTRSPICCAVAKHHRYAARQILTMEDFDGECIVMPIEGVSAELDGFRQEVLHNHPAVRIIDSSYYGVDTFTLCEINPYILITQPIYSDIHTNLITIPLETDYTMPYGLIYANEPTAATEKFIQATKKMLKKGELKNI